MKAVIEQYLQHIRQNVALTEQEARFIGQGLQVETFAPRALLSNSGKICRAMSYVVSGLFKAFYTKENGEQVNINFLPEGSYAGDFRSYLEQSPARYSYQTIETTTVIHLPYAWQQQCLAQIPPLERYFRRQLEQALLFYLQRTEHLLTENAERRYRDFCRDNPTLFQRLSVSDLCSYLGIQRQSLTRIRKKMEN